MEPKGSVFFRALGFRVWDSGRRGFGVHCVGVSWWSCSFRAASMLIRVV